MYLKLLETLVLKKENAVKLLLRRKYYGLLNNKLQFDNNYSLQHQIKFNLQDSCTVNPSNLYRNFSISNNK